MTACGDVRLCDSRQCDSIKGTSGKLIFWLLIYARCSLPPGKRGVLWGWLGQIRHLPSPPVGIASSLTCLHTPVPGMSSRVILLPDNTAQIDILRGARVFPTCTQSLTMTRKRHRVGRECSLLRIKARCKIRQYEANRSA